MQEEIRDPFPVKINGYVVLAALGQYNTCERKDQRCSCRALFRWCVRAKPDRPPRSFLSAWTLRKHEDQSVIAPELGAVRSKRKCEKEVAEWDRKGWRSDLCDPAAN